VVNNANFAKKNRWQWSKDLKQESFDPFIYIYGLVCILAMLLTVNESTLTSNNISLAVFGPFWYACFLSRSFRKSLKKEALFKTGATYLLVVFGFFMFSAMGSGFVDIVNGLTSSKRIVIAEGRVVNKTRSGRYDAMTLYLQIDDRDVGLKVASDIYDRAKIGDYYVSNYRLGGFGYYYRWRINSWNKWEKQVPLVLNSFQSMINSKSK
jgi:hypothetical protein